jgi:protein-disulfide isomerase
MASRKDLKEQARAQRLAEEQAAAARAHRTRRLQLLGGVVAVAAIVVVVAIVLSVSGAGKSTGTNGLAKGKTQSATVASVQGLLAGIPQATNTLGSPSAPVKVTYYGDLECPVCQEFTLQGGWPQMVQNQVRAGKVQVTYSAFETATRNPQTFDTQQVAALAAGMQGKFWQFVELFYHEQGQEDTGYVTESYLDGLAKQIPGLNYAKWLSDRKDPALLAQVQSQEAGGTSAGVQGTPTLVFTGPKGKTSPSAGVPDYSQLEQAFTQVS